jgi:hypothetical protein
MSLPYYYVMVVGGVGSTDEPGPPPGEFGGGGYVAYRSRGVASNLVAAALDMRRGRISSRAERTMAMLQAGIDTGRPVVVLAISHGALLVANALSRLGARTSRVSVVTMGAPRMLPRRTTRYEIGLALNLYHEKDPLLPLALKFRRRQTDRLLRGPGGGMYRVVSRAEVPRPANPHVCWTCLRVLARRTPELDALRALVRALRI